VTAWRSVSVDNEFALAIERSFVFVTLDVVEDEVEIFETVRVPAIYIGGLAERLARAFRPFFTSTAPQAYEGTLAALSELRGLLVLR
jgi:hypothetical protein